MLVFSSVTYGSLSYVFRHNHPKHNHPPQFFGPDTMTIAPPIDRKTTFRFTSIEPIGPLNTQFQNIAEKNGCDIEFQSESIVNAPFCGINYHVQDVSLKSIVEANHTDNIARCIEQFTLIEIEQIADGFFEVIS